MPEPEVTPPTAKILHGIDEISTADWDSCHAGVPLNPFLTHRFLAALERSGSVSAQTGWQPFHIVVQQEQTLIGVIPAYLKNHSQGEYVFDYGWADAWHRAGGNYYPKMQISVPFTPATGPRFLARSGSDADTRLLIDAAMQVAHQVDVSSIHVTFMPEQQWQCASQAGFLQRMDQQFHWHNGGYATFDDFLAQLASKKRKNIRRERRDALANDIEVEWITGADLTEAHWDAFYQFYVDTGSRKWGSPYLNRRFFSEINEVMPDDVLLIMAKRAGRYIAGAINFIGADTLFGRNWGCIEDHPFLHFEICYYQAIDFAIAHGLKHVEAGAQGAHKVARGYLPEATYSAHWIADPGFRDAVARFLDDERRYVEQDLAYVEQHTPFNIHTDLKALREIQL
ncbi:MAG: GNAT family N-acetyltransferase [Pseudomonadales bacterium]